MPLAQPICLLNLNVAHEKVDEKNQITQRQLLHNSPQKHNWFRAVDSTKTMYDKHKLHKEKRRL